MRARRTRISRCVRAAEARPRSIPTRRSRRSARGHWYRFRMAEHRRRVDKVLDPGFLDGLSDWPLDELRSCHAECLEIETEVSYVRRVAQARLDILEAE